MYSNYPMGTWLGDPRAPWNQDDEEEEEEREEYWDEWKIDAMMEDGEW